MSFTASLVTVGAIICKEQRNALLLVVLVVVALLYEGIASHMMTTISSFYAAIADNDRRLFASTIVQSIAIVMTLALVKATRGMLRESAALFWRITLVTFISKQLLAHDVSKDLYRRCPKGFLFGLDQR